jgi:hypothetical protein
MSLPLVLLSEKSRVARLLASSSTTSGFPSGAGFTGRDDATDTSTDSDEAESAQATVRGLALHAATLAGPVSRDPTPRFQPLPGAVGAASSTLSTPRVTPEQRGESRLLSARDTGAHANDLLDRRLSEPAPPVSTAALVPPPSQAPTRTAAVVSVGTATPLGWPAVSSGRGPLSSGEAAVPVLNPLVIGLTTAGVRTLQRSATNSQSAPSLRTVDYGRVGGAPSEPPIRMLQERRATDAPPSPRRALPPSPGAASPPPAATLKAGRHPSEPVAAARFNLPRAAVLTSLPSTAVTSLSPRLRPRVLPTRGSPSLLEGVSDSWGQIRLTASGSAAASALLAVRVASTPRAAFGHYAPKLPESADSDEDTVIGPDGQPNHPSRFAKEVKF